MAWPLTPIQTFIANVTRWTASFANQLQAGVNGIVAGTYSLLGVVVDGVGGVVSTAVAGAISMSTPAGSTTVPSPLTVARKVFYGDMQPYAMAIVDQASSGTAVVKWGVNVAGIATNGAGDWTIQLKTAAPALARMGAQATAMASGNTANAIPQDTTHVRVTTFNMAAAPALQNSVVFLTVYAGD